MTRTKKTSYPPLNIGTSFMLVIFIILCMVIFAVLSFSSALKDYHYSQKNAGRNTAYYEAANEAERVLSRVDAVLALELLKLQEIEDLEIEVLKASDTDASMADASAAITYTIPIDETKALEVSLTTHPHGSRRYTINTWKQISSTEWTGDQSLPVLGSE